MSAINFSQWPRMSRMMDELLDADAARRTEQLAEIAAHDPEMARLLARQVEVDTTHFLEGTALTAAARVSIAELLAQAAARARARRQPLRKPQDLRLRLIRQQGDRRRVAHRMPASA